MGYSSDKIRKAEYIFVWDAPKIVSVSQLPVVKKALFLVHPKQIHMDLLILSEL